MKIRLVNNSATAIEVGATDGTRQVISAMGGAHSFEPDMQTQADLDILVQTGQYYVVEFGAHLSMKLAECEALVTRLTNEMAVAEDKYDEVTEEIRLYQAEIDAVADAASKKAEEEAAAKKIEEEAAAAAIKAEEDAAASAAKKTKKD